MAESYEKHLKGYKFRSAEERRIAEDWMKSHAGDIPSMDEGNSIGGQKIVYCDPAALIRLADKHGIVC